MIPPLSHGRRAAVPLLIAVVLMVFASTACQTAQQDLRSRVNAERTSRGIAALADAGDLTSKAESQAALMARNGRLSHSDLSSGVSSSWTRLGENVGYGGSIADVDAMLMGSSAHRDNILSPSYTGLGIGVARGADGLYYVAQEFGG